MESLQKRQKLHLYIDMVDDEKVNALFTILEADDTPQYSAEAINMFYERQENYLKGQGKNFSVEESFEEIRKSK